MGEADRLMPPASFHLADHATWVNELMTGIFFQLRGLMSVKESDFSSRNTE